MLLAITMQWQKPTTEVVHIREIRDDGDAMTINDAYDGTCNCVGEAIVEGCTSESACNYDGAANTDDGSCFFVGDACDDGDASTGGDVIGDDCQCVGFEIVLGCTDSTACNYDSAADESDGSCVYPGDSCDDGFNSRLTMCTKRCSCGGTLVPTGPAGIEVEIRYVRVWDDLPLLMRRPMNSLRCTERLVKHKTLL